MDLAADQPEPEPRLYVRRGLEGMAAEIVEAGDGLEALQRLAGLPVDLVIADSQMPRLDGTELARVLTGSGVLVLLLNGMSSGEAPHVWVLEKPFDRRQLRSAIQAMKIRANSRGPPRRPASAECSS